MCASAETETFRGLFEKLDCGTCGTIGGIDAVVFRPWVGDVR